MKGPEQASSSRRFAPHELATLHELDPSEQEIITEGSVDACVISWFFRSQGIRLPVYDIATRVEVSAKSMSALGLSYGKRNLVIAAAKELAEYKNVPTDSVLFVIDGDYDYTLSPPPPTEKSLLITDYTDIETYCFDPQVLGKYLGVSLRASEVDPQSALDSIANSLSDLFAVRWFLHHLPGSPKIVAKLSNKLSMLDGAVIIDSITLLRDSVRRSSIASVKGMTNEELQAGFSEVRTRLDGDPRFRIRGHDYPVALSYYLSRAHSHCYNGDREKFKDPDVACATLLASLDSAYLTVQPLFAELLKRVKDYRS
jgi:hypothetical protein